MVEERKLFEVSVRYTDGSDELLLLAGEDYEEAEVEAEAWVDYKKTVKDITAVKEIERKSKPRRLENVDAVKEDGINVAE